MYKNEKKAGGYMHSPKIKMIICDVDGTLLTRNQDSISNNVFHAIENATNKNIQFVIASGRCYTSLRNLFTSVKENVYFVCNDGSLAVKSDKILYSAPLKMSLISDFINNFLFSSDESLILYGKDYTYCMGKDIGFDSLKKIVDTGEIYESIYKISFYNLSDISKYKIRSFAQRSKMLTEIYSDTHWTEFIAQGTHKGSAVVSLQKQLNISPFETAAFGDNINDIEMLRQARLSFASPDAIPDIQRMCKYNTYNVANEILNMIEKGECYE